MADRSQPESPDSNSQTEEQPAVTKESLPAEAATSAGNESEVQSHNKKETPTLRPFILVEKRRVNINGVVVEVQIVEVIHPDGSEDIFIF